MVLTSLFSSLPLREFACDQSGWSAILGRKRKVASGGEEITTLQLCATKEVWSREAVCSNNNDNNEQKSLR